MLVATDVEAALHSLPPTLTQLYVVIIERIDRIASHGRHLAMKALRWLLCARTPLTAKTLIEILEPDEPGSGVLAEQVLSLCCNLVVLDDSLNVFRFAHASVREFLESQPTFSFHNINLQAAQECFQMVSSPQGIHKAEFTLYANKFWMEHYRSLGFHFRSRQPLATDVKNFFNRGMTGDDMFVSWAENEEVVIEPTLRALTTLGSFHSPLHIACLCGLLEIVDMLVAHRDIVIDSTATTNATGLYLAACNGDADIVERLLSKGADPNIYTSSQESALHRAAEVGHEATALLLLQHGADMAVQDDQGWTALDWAVKGDHVGVVRLLILNGSKIEAKQKYGEPLIDWANTTSTNPSQYRIEGLSILHRATGCIGIKNEGQTGYLNAILHLLYSIKPFHDLLGMLPTSDEDHPTVSDALHALFEAMLSSMDVVSTRRLTTAFGWDLEILQQPNDPFEMFKALMDNLENHEVAVHTFANLFWSELEDLRRFRPTETTISIPVDITRNDTFEKAFEDFCVDDDKDSPQYGLARWQLSRSALVLIFELRRFQYNMQTYSIEKVSHCTPLAS